jgi:glycosyltransferase involved in cell wall biosynthesis
LKSGQPIRVAIVAPSLRILGGQAVQADRLIRAWQGDPAVHARLVAVNPLPPKPLRRLVDIKYVRTLVTELAYIPRLVRELARTDVVHVFSASYVSFLLAPLPAIVVARALGRPVILNYRSGEAPDHLQRSAIARRTIARVDRNIVPSSFLVEVFRGYGIRASIIPNVVDLDRFRYRRRVPLRPLLLSTRNFEPLYNVACTLRAFRIVQDRWPDAALTLVGGGAQESMLRKLAAGLGLRHVTFAGRVPPDEIAGYYAGSDIYIQSPNIDNMPTSVIEAYASGLPVVSTAAGGVPDILSDGENGLLAPLDDHVALAAGVLRLLADADLADRLARAAYACCRACTWASVREQWLAAYRSVMADSDSAANIAAVAADRAAVSEPTHNGSAAAPWP